MEKRLEKCFTSKTYKKNDKCYYSDLICMVDTETSNSDYLENSYVCKYSVAFSQNSDSKVLSFYGNKPSELIVDIENIFTNTQSDKALFFVHNLNYDWTFLRKFFIKKFGLPVRQLNIKPHKPILIEFGNGVVLRDSLILASGRSLEKWGNDLQVIHKKAVGKWDYEIIRNQSDNLNREEEEYVLNDVICGVECLQVLCKQNNCTIARLPLTQTGFIRNEIKKRGKLNNGNFIFKKNIDSIDVYKRLVEFYHGGYTHGNRYLANFILKGVKGFDFTSSYPYVLLVCKFPMETFRGHNIKDYNTILDNSGEYAFLFRLVLKNIKLKENKVMPIISLYKSLKRKCVNPIVDNGRIVQADFIDIECNEIMLKLIIDNYDIETMGVYDVLMSRKAYLPKYITDYIYELFRDKTKLKGVDDILYNISKFNLNGVYGMMVQKILRDIFVEHFDTSDELFIYTKTEYKEEDYNRFCNSWSNVLSYHWGCWVTSYAMKNLFELGSFCDIWVYSDTDSVYGIDWNESKVQEYNKKCIYLMNERGYPPIEWDGKSFCLGVAETENEMQPDKFIHLGSKKYAKEKDGKISITVAGVPKKKGSNALKDLRNFKTGFIFKGTETGKKTVKYVYVDDIFIDKYGNEIGDSILLTPCDYLLKNSVLIDDNFLYEEEFYENIL